MVSDDVAKDLYDQGLAAFRQGDQEKSRRLNEQALEIARADDDQLNQVRALIGLSRVAFRDEDHDRLRELCATATPMFERLEDPSLVTSPIHMMAESARMQGEFDRARELYERSIEMSRRANDDETLATELNNTALLELAAGDPSRALALAREALALGGDELLTAYCSLAIGAALVATGATEPGVEALAATTKRIEQAGIVLDPADQPVLDNAIARARQALTGEQFEAAWERGRSRSFEEAVASLK